MNLLLNIAIRKALDLLEAPISLRYDSITKRSNGDLDKIISHFYNYGKPTAEMIKKMDPQDVADKMDLLMQGLYELAVTARKERNNGFFSFLR